MPDGWSKARDLAKMAERRALVELEVPLGELPGVPEEFSRADGPVQVRMQFGREQGLATVHVRLEAVLRPVCQRCLKDMRLAVAADSRLALVDSEAQAASVPEEFETFLAPDGHGSLAALASEELLLALPLVPRHGPGERCVADAEIGAATQAPGDAPQAGGETQRPFADLRALLDRKKD
jgi:uncharacterized protein